MILRRTAFLAVSVLVLGLAPPAHATSGTLTINSDTTLTEDHDGDIVIVADKVTLDCAGHTVDADPWLWAAILVNGQDDVTVRNCRATNGLNGIAVDGSSARTLLTGNEAFGNAAAGIAVANAVDTSIVDNSATGNLDNGIGLFQVAGVHVVSNVVSMNQGTAGIAMFRAHWGVFRDNTSRDNVHNGWNVIESDDNVFGDNISSGNGASGFNIFDSNHSRLEANASTGNAWNGFEVRRSPEMTWSDNDAIDNGDSGFVLVEGSDDASLVRNVAAGNAGRGFALEGVSQTLLNYNVARDNAGDGFSLRDGTENEFIENRSSDNGTYGFVPNGDGAVTTDNTVARNQALRNGFEGIALVFGASNNEVIGNLSQGGDFEGISLYFGSDNNVIRANVSTLNASSGVLVFQSSYNLITNNRAIRNNTNRYENQGGISVIDESDFNEILNNVACGNGNADGYADGSGSGNVWQANVFCSTSGL